MVKITIDGKQLEVEKNLTIIQAAINNGIYIPHFCWHPVLSVAGNCRICLVEVEKSPKLVIACATVVADGMVVYTNTERVINARKAVMEFLLINHPLDCPICDEAGECKLQEYAYKYGSGQSRFDFEKVRKPKRVDLGEYVMLDVERCIMCSRCIRFFNEIVNKPQLTFTQRGDRVTLSTFPGEKLDSPYSMNIIDLCPVGALTSKPFRFKARVWEMSATETICPGCARGCNINMWVRNNEILRLTPRFNPNVNNYWMCDNGRINSFKSVNAQDRVNAPMVRKDGILEAVDWDEAIAEVASRIRLYKKNEIAAVASPYSTNEDIYIFLKLIRFMGISNVFIFEHEIPGDEDNLLICADKTPNKRGALEVGFKFTQHDLMCESLISNIQSGKIRLLYCLDDDIASISSSISKVLSKLDFLIVHASNENATTALADVVLSSSSFAERDGTYTNRDGWVQRIRPAVATIEQDRALDNFAMSRLDKFGAHNDSWTKGVKRNARPTWKIIMSIANALGAKLNYQSAEDVFNEICVNVPAFKGMNYLKIGSQGMKLSKVKEVVTTEKK